MERTEIRYMTKVPDTLDLAERARVGINALTGIIVPGENYQPQKGVQSYRNPPVMKEKERTRC